MGRIGTTGWDTKLIAMILVMGIPLIGMYLFITSMGMEDPTFMYVGIFLVLLFPLIIAFNVLRSKTGTRKR